MNKKSLFLTLVLLFLSIGLTTACEAKTKLRSSKFTVDAYFAVAGFFKDSVFYTTVATPGGVYYGVYQAPAGGMYINSQFRNLSWTGPGSAPIWTVADFHNSVKSSNCPGMPSKFSCMMVEINITLESDDYGCPWVSSLYVTSPLPGGGGTYKGPSSRYTICPTVPVDTYDISWNPNFVQHDKFLSITPTGGTVNQTLPTYLMESGTLCDGSKFDDRGAYCRFVATGVTLTVKGCDNKIVTTTAVEHPITDKELHDINVAVNTKNVGTGTITSTCNFQYIIEQL